MFPNFDTFNTTMTACTANRECLVLDNTQTSNEITDCVFWYKAELKEPFRLGSAKYWKYGQRMKRDEMDSDDDDDDQLQVDTRQCVRVKKTN